MQLLNRSRPQPQLASARPAGAQRLPLRYVAARASSYQADAEASDLLASSSEPAELNPPSQVVNVEPTELQPIAPAVLSAKAREIRAALLDSLYGTERGLTARSEVRAEINELINQLETFSSNDMTLESVSGTWRLIYSSTLTTIAVLSASRLPLLAVGDYVQMVDTSSMTVTDKVEVSAAGLAKTYLSSVATFSMASPKRMQLAYEKAILHTPEPVTDASLPTSVNLLGQNLDISMLSNMLQPIAERVTNTLASAGDMLGQTPGLQVPADRFSTWLLNTYVDESVRIVRGDGGAVQVFVRQ